MCKLKLVQTIAIRTPSDRSGALNTVLTCNHRLQMNVAYTLLRPQMSDNYQIQCYMKKKTCNKTSTFCFSNVGLQQMELC